MFRWSSYILGFLMTLGPMSALASSEFGEKEAARPNFNSMIESSQSEIAEISGDLDSDYKKNQKIKDGRIKKLVKDELGWSDSENAMIHRVPQSLDKPMIDMRAESLGLVPSYVTLK